MQKEAEVGRVSRDTALLVSFILDCGTAPEVPAQASAGVFQLCVESAHPKVPLVVWNRQRFGESGYFIEPPIAGTQPSTQSYLFPVDLKTH